MENSKVFGDQYLYNQNANSPKCSKTAYQQEPFFDQEPNQISEIEKFIQKNYRDVTDLQSYLIKQLQYIQNCKSRNKKVDKIITISILPTLEHTKQAINSFKPIFELFNSLTANYIEALAEKSRSLLNEKQQKCQRYQYQIKSLKKEIQQLKQKQLSFDLNHGNVERPIPLKIENSKHKYLQAKKLETQLTQFYEAKEKQLLSSNNKKEKVLNNVNCSKNQHEVSRFKDSSSQQEHLTKNKSASKLNKYEQCYQNILKAKKVNISYKCDKTPIKEKKESLSPSQTPHHLNSALKTGRQESQAMPEDRKQYIKQKIEKIKLKAECKEYQRNVTPKQRFR